MSNRNAARSGNVEVGELLDAGIAVQQDRASRQKLCGADHSEATAHARHQHGILPAVRRLDPIPSPVRFQLHRLQRIQTQGSRTPPLLLPLAPGSKGRLRFGDDGAIRSTVCQITHTRCGHSDAGHNAALLRSRSHT
jgi:hypothetical protein